MAVVKPKDNNMISDSFSLSYPNSFSLTHALQLSVTDCMINRELSIYTSFLLDNNLPGLTYLGESNNPSAPQPLINKEG